MQRPFAILLLLGAVIFSGEAGAARRLVLDQCRLYGYIPHTWAYAQCRMDVRRYWTTGPCSDARFALVHPDYCHLSLPPFI